MSRKIRVKPEADFEDGDREIIDVDDRSIGVIKYDGEFYALSNTCLHDGGPVCSGRVSEKMDAEFAGTGRPLEWGHTDEVVVSCPWHGWTYDIETGTHLGDDDIQLPTYDVRIEDGDVYVVLE